MDLILKFGSILYICTLFADSKVVASGIGKPVILPSTFETIIESNENHTVFCQGNRPLKWTTPPIQKGKESWTKFIWESEKLMNSSYQYGSKLQIINMTYLFVGFYYCQYNDSDTDNESIYLYVNDPDHLTILELNTVKGVFVVQSQEAIIPCKPTSPDIRVSLCDNALGDDIKMDIQSSDETVYRYDPKYGFITNNTKTLNRILFLCKFQRSGEIQEAHVQMVVERPISHLAIPHIRDLSEGHSVTGQTLVLECIIKMINNDVHFHWGTPKEVNKNIMRPHYEKKGDFLVDTLTIPNVTKLDSGSYFCNVTDNQQHSSQGSLVVNIFDVDEHFLTVEEENKAYSVLASAGDPSVQWDVTVKGHPKPYVTWLDTQNKTIYMGNGTKYEAYYNSAKNRAFLKIKDITINDFGNFTLLTVNKRTQVKKFFLNVTDKPKVELEIKPFLPVNTQSTVKCYASANPEPEFHWYFKPCQSTTCDYVPVNGKNSKIGEFKFVSEVTINANESGYLKCHARNYQGNSSIIKGLHVSDISNGFAVFSLDKDVDVNEQDNSVTIIKGDTTSVICGASDQNYSDVTWFFKNKVLTNNDRYRLTNSSTRYSNKLELQMQQTDVSDSGLYSCRVLDKNGKYLYRNMTFNVANPEQPQIINSTLQDEKEMNLPDRLVLYCKVFGVPKPVVKWYKNGVAFHTETKRIQISDNNEEITFLQTIVQDQGTYKCEATNRMGSTQKQGTVKFKNVLKADYSMLFTIIILLSLVSIGTFIFIVIKIRKEKLLQRELKLLGLANFQKGAVENINPELGIDEQAELLPYDQKWEFPIEHLKLGKQLGSGAFGVVMKGVAKRIVEGEEETPVAVKMVKKNTDHIYIKALVSELKIMIHLGKHLNVVNLLGACTKNVAKRELLVIVEFCRFGNLQNYLFKHRDNYIDQVDPKTGKIDYASGQELFDRTYSVSSDRSNGQSPLLKYAALTFSNITNRTVLSPSKNGYYKANSDPCSTTDITTSSQGEEGVVISNNSVQPDWRSNYKGDYKGNVKPICTKDLLAWAFQVARGMHYLASRKVLHGDLAARNILLADNNVVKICDFGLAKSMYKNDNYKKKGNGPLPIKWMAIESIRDRVFSTQSDVWSFGIVLWEFFSLARTPYPGMEADERLYQKLLDGYRMESPHYAPKEVYKMMTDCWSSTPLARPSFEKLSERLGSLLEDTIKNHYIDLNDSYLVMNTQRLGQTDYLAMLNSPTFEALSSPHYVNEMVGQELFGDSGYLSMRPNTIFSPRVEEGPVFDFKVKNLNSEEGNAMEMTPMLRRDSDSGCETTLQSPMTPNSVSNPSYLIIPNAGNEDKGSSNAASKIVKSQDNYVNVPQSKEEMMS
ncbi:vascular endothelial growth factor receptor 1-like [Anoplophora glabripennis]|uniref:vascular endothelial growth factor receptor 1-like n=1 Tax=Anoplophora glabripennis TaxID=217634 RepID=UPI000873D000|nr:vascular endothelial growth factor receptor 1-like [Anoplophora glabripennis]